VWPSRQILRLEWTWLFDETASATQEAIESERLIPTFYIFI